MADTAEPAAPGWSPPKSDPETGVALYGDLPLNHRLRAEALADAGASEDPDGLILPELIEDARTRLKATRADEDRAVPSMRWERADLLAHAEKIPGLVIETDANKAAILKAITAASTASTTTEG